MDDVVERVRDLLREAGQIHHAVWRIHDGDDPDWASWYSDWLVNLSELPEILGRKPVRSELTHALVELGRAQSETEEPWEDAYARAIVERFLAM